MSARRDVLVILILIEVMVLLVVVARRWGWRPGVRRFGLYFGQTIVDLGRPAKQLYRFHRDIRIIGDRLSDPALPDLLIAADEQIRGALHDHSDSWPYAILVSRTHIDVAVAGPSTPPPPPPWQDRDGWWSATLTAVAASGAETHSTNNGGWPVAVGVLDDRLVLLDLGRAPGVLTLSGPQRTVFSVLCAIAAQLSTGPPGSRPVELLVTDGVHPRFSGPPLAEALGTLERRHAPTEGDDQMSVLICGRPSPEESRRMSTLCERIPMLRIVTAGPYLGSSWRLPLSATARISATELDLHADASALERGVARVVQRSARRRTQTPFPSIPPTTSVRPLLPVASPRTTKPAPSETETGIAKAAAKLATPSRRPRTRSSAAKSVTESVPVSENQTFDPEPTVTTETLTSLLRSTAEKPF